MQVTRGLDGRRRALLFAGVFAVALAAGLAYPLCVLYASEVSLYLLLGEWSWNPVSSEGASPGELLSAALAAGPLTLFGAAVLPAAVCLSAARAGLGRYLFGRHPSIGCSGLGTDEREHLRRGLQSRLGRTVVLDPPSHQTARLAGFLAGFVLFWHVFGGAS